VVQRLRGAVFLLLGAFVAHVDVVLEAPHPDVQAEQGWAPGLVKDEVVCALWRRLHNTDDRSNKPSRSARLVDPTDQLREASQVLRLRLSGSGKRIPDQASTTTTSVKKARS